MSKKLVLLDGFSLANRAFFALPPLSTSSGQPTNAVYGMAMMLLKLLDESKPNYIITAFDVAAPTFRHQQFEAYKGHRLKMEDSLKIQFPIIRKLLEILKIPIIEEPGFEADDIIGTLAKQVAGQGITVEIVTGDRDSFQLVEANIKVLYTRKGITDVDRVDETYIFNRYQLKPEQLIDLKSLMGDASDNIPGIPGFGEKTALKYLHQFHSLDGIYENLGQVSKQRDRELLEKYRDQAYLSRQLAEIVTDVEIIFEPSKCCKHQDYSKAELIDFCKEYEFNSLAKKLSDNPELENFTQLQPLDFEVKILEDQFLDSVLNKIRQEKYCYLQLITTVANWEQTELLGVGLGTSHENWFLPMTSNQELPDTLRKMLADEGIAKYGHDLKKQMQIAFKAGFSIKGQLEDTLIASYLVNAGVGNLELEELGSSYLQKLVPAWKNDRGKIFSVFLLPEGLPEKVLADITGGRLEAIRQLKNRLSEMLGDITLEKLYREIELPLIKVLFSMEKEGIKLNPDTLREFGRELKKRQNQLEKEIYSLVNEEFNISSPKQLGKILFEKLGLKAPKKTKTGYSTDAEVLETLSDEHPVIPKILEYRQNLKLQTTYIDALINLINSQTGRVHTTFNQAVTTTGRLSSTEPNLQNIPIRSEEGRIIRSAFIPESEEYRLLAADYSQIELRVMAHFSDDQAYREAFLKGEDIHRFTAAAVYGLPVAEVTKEMRDKAKAVNFGIIYGISGFGLAKNIRVSRKEADTFIETYFQKYPGVKDYVEKLIEEARKTGEAKTMMGRVRKLPDLHSRNFTLRSFAERMARNTPVQGTAADIIKIAMVKIAEQLNRKPELGKMLLQVHDELVFEVPESKWRDLAIIVKNEMENAVKLNVPLVVDLKMGTNWGEMIHIDLAGFRDESV